MAFIKNDISVEMIQSIPQPIQELKIRDKNVLIHDFVKKIPHITKYMGSKRDILEFVIESINELYEGGKICDLFAGTSILSGALGQLIPMHSNDIQEYSSVLANTYLSDYKWNNYPSDILEEICKKASKYVKKVNNIYPEFIFSYNVEMDIEEFVNLEKQQQALIDFDFDNKLTHHLFIKYYSGTYWTFQQCLWIDAIRKTADDYKDSPLYYIILSSLMYAMAYNSQSTGHYAQYRDATNSSSKADILIYRQKEILPLFIKKFNQLKSYLGENGLKHIVTTLDYRECLDLIDESTLVYADPPYAFVHYSRFYHALETLVKYDYPKVDHKGRYRTDRHQSPFGRRKEVKSAFSTLFKKVKSKNAQLILSYSNTGMITLSEIVEIAKGDLGEMYQVYYKECKHKHSTMGRTEDKKKDVTEYLIICKPN